MSKTHQGMAIVVGLIAFALVAEPGFRANLYDDGFPLSTYPMFAKKRSAVVLDLALGYPASGDIQRIPPKHIASGQVLQAHATLRAAVRQGKKSQLALCQKVAQKVAQDADFDAVIQVALVRAKYDPATYFDATRAAPKPTRTWVRCPVERTP